MRLKYRRLLRFNYWQLFVCGLIAVPVNLSRPQLRCQSKSRYVYLCYSSVICVVLLVDISYSAPATAIEAKYMRQNILLQWSFLVNYTLRLAMIICWFGLVWLRRNRLAGLYHDWIRFVQRYEHFILDTVERRAKIVRLENYLANMLLKNCLVCYLYVVCSISVQWQIHYFNDAGENMKTLLITLSCLLIITLAKIELYTMLAIGYHQFQCIQFALTALHGRMLDDERRGRLYNSEVTQKEHFEALQKLAAMHNACARLTQRNFAAFNIRNALLFLCIFCTSINICYHGVQYQRATVKSDGLGMVMGFFLEVFHFWSAVMLMNIMDRLLNACNNVGQLLRKFNDLLLFNKQFEQELEIFAQRVRSDKLIYKICNLVEFNRPSCLRCMVSMLIYVIILMQFDMAKKIRAA